MGYNIIAAAFALTNNLVGKFVKTANVTSTEAITTEGQRFNQAFDFTLSNAETRYFLYQLPAGVPVTVGLQNRTFKSFSGSCDLEILWESTGFTEGVLDPVFNEYNKYSNNNVFRASEITAPTVEGVIRETDFLVGSGSGNSSSGDVSNGSGYRLYQPDTFFIAKVTNLENSNNRVILGYSWIEIPEELLKL